MKAFLPLLTLGLLAAPAAAQQPQRPTMTLEQQMMVRCSAVFAVVAGDQARGVPSARAYPPIAQRGKEFFVRSNARLMDDLNLTREQVQDLMNTEAKTIQTRSKEDHDPAAYLDGLMKPCLSALDASGL
ncbi:hypothetical protein [Altererythrobacter sp. Root672]|uniref:hypothetical protein n=1 Tax=Altererythrobacter sp. Root672 TaxID=1736584 RepID=UPI0006F3CAC9|nr:hypothetical protein [Altererythrobacter sp. Root672]KRA80648.1 hypothetical protein ASD76_16005 [Altererythrobacter sp. Root672]